MLSGTSKQQQPVNRDENFRMDHLKDDLAGRSGRGDAVIACAQVYQLPRGERYARWEPIRQPANVPAASMATTTRPGRGSS